MKHSRRKCFREPIPEITTAARMLNDAVSEHVAGRFARAEELIYSSDIRAIRDWTESIWGANSPYVVVNELDTDSCELANAERVPVRMPSAEEKRQLIDRDGFHCRFCEIPVIRRRIRTAIRTAYPNALPWGRKNEEQHAAFQAMWLQYDHLLPHARGGENSLGNIVITCAPCNFGRMNYLLEEVGLADPFSRDPTPSNWDGLERFVQTR